MLALFNLGGTEIILILAIALLLFGGKKLPELAKGLGQGIKEFKKATGNASETVREAMEDASTRRLSPAPADAERTASTVSPGPTDVPANV
jgi:sec-independent protein translocase protein TatA